MEAGEALAFAGQSRKERGSADDPKRRIQVPGAPGIGVDIDEQKAYRYRKPGENFFE